MAVTSVSHQAYNAGKHVGAVTFEGHKGRVCMDISYGLALDKGVSAQTDHAGHLPPIPLGSASNLRLPGVVRTS